MQRVRLIARFLSVFFINCSFYCAQTKGELIAAGGYHSLFLCDTGLAKGCGYNYYGGLGNGTTGLINPVPVPVSAITGIEAVSAGGTYFSLFLKSDSTVWGCGFNWFGQLGDGTVTDKVIPVQVDSLSGITLVMAGMEHSLFLKADSTVWGCGSNNNGQLGNGPGYSSTPIQLNVPDNIIAISTKGYSSFFLKSDGTVWACGSNNFGQLGDGTTIDKSVPFQITSLTGILGVAAGEYHTLFLKNDNTVWACGYNGNGQLGDGTTTDRLIPVQMNSSSNTIAVSAGYFHSLLLKSDSTVWGCGANANGQLGNGTTSLNDSFLVQIPSFSSVKMISCGGYHSLVLKSDGSVWAFGRNHNGQLGDGTTASKSTPTQIPDLCSFGTGIGESAFGINVSIYPNPSSDYLFIENFPEDEPCEITICDIAGNQLKSVFSNEKKLKIDLENATCGMYLVKIRSQNGSVTRKIIVEK